MIAKIHDETVRLARRREDPPTVILAWYRSDEDLPVTCGAVLTEYGHKVYYRGCGRWDALGTDGGYYAVDPPRFWCYIPTIANGLD